MWQSRLDSSSHRLLKVDKSVSLPEKEI
jgi:hypothetical protein